MNTLPHGWELRMIDDVFDVQQGKAVSVKARSGDNIQPFLRTANVFWNRLDLTVLDQMHFSESDVKKLTLREGDILVCEGGDIGRTAVWRGEVQPCYYQNHLHRLRAKRENEVHPDFFGLWMETAILLFGLYTAQGNKTTIPNLSSGRLKAFTFPLPPLLEQKAIATTLRAVQDAKSARLREIEIERERKSALMEELFRLGIRGEELRETELGMLPKSWRVVKLLNVIEKFVSGGTPTTKDATLWDGDIGWTTSAPIGESDVDLSRPQRFIAAAALTRSAANLVPRGNLLVGTRVGVGKAVRNLTDIAISQDLTGVILRHEVVTSEFLAYYFKLTEVQNFIAGRKRGTTIQGISRFDLENIPLRLPPLPEQQAIAATLRACNSKISILEHEIELHDELFHALLEELMTGRIRTMEMTE